MLFNRKRVIHCKYVLSNTNMGFPMQISVNQLNTCYPESLSQRARRAAIVQQRLPEGSGVLAHLRSYERCMIRTDPLYKLSLTFADRFHTCYLFVHLTIK